MKLNLISRGKLILIAWLLTSVMIFPVHATVTIFVDETLELDVLENEADGEKKKVWISENGLNGKVSIKADSRTIVYKPDKGFIGNDVIKYSVGETEDKAIEKKLPVKVLSGLASVLSPDQLSQAGIVLFQALVLAIILELALHRIFDYRYFILYFEGRGFKVPLSVLLALALVHIFDMNLVSKLMEIFSLPTSEPASKWVTYPLTAVILSGGSSTIFRLYKALGMRTPVKSGNGSEIENREFGRVTIKVIRGETSEQGKNKPLDIFLGNKLIGTMESESTTFPSGKYNDYPVETTTQKIAVAVSPHHVGEGKWERELTPPRLSRTVVYFDLKKKKTGANADGAP